VPLGRIDHTAWGRIDHTAWGRIVQTGMGRICSGANMQWGEFTRYQLVMTQHFSLLDLKQFCFFLFISVFSFHFRKMQM
jgi:hypothetical protein